MSKRHENPKHVQGDGAGFGRLRAAQRLRETFTDIIKRTHPSCAIYVDQVREYAGVQIVFYRAEYKESVPFEHARIAVFEWKNPSSTRPGHWVKENDIIAAQSA